MKILLTNDDGYSAKGINILFEHLQKYGEVIMIAPLTQQSAKSTSLTFNPKTLTEVGTNKYALDGTPADCVNFATRYLANDWDLVVSGCNDGINIVYDTCYSGTIGATIEANIQGYPTMAISTDEDAFEIVENEIDDVLKFVFDNKLINEQYILNINFPTADHKESKGYRLATLGNRYGDLGWKKLDDGTYLPIRDVKWNNAVGENNDSDLVKAGYVTFTPLTWSHFDARSYSLLRDVFEK